jgi:ABC-2 type transport system ATP-binding protein
MADNAPPAAISVRRLTKNYDGVRAVAGVRFEIAFGEIFALLGPNGAGKTSVLEILEGFRPRTGGDVAVLGIDPQEGDRSWRERIGIVLQESQPDPGLTVREAVSLYAGYYDHPRPVSETLARVGLERRAQQLATTLSGGERRRLDVALALVGDPDLLFLDEPTTGFDPSARRAAWEMIEDLRGTGTTIVLTTHYLDEAERLADRIAVMVAGTVVAEGTPATLGGRDRADAVVRFRIAEPDVAAALPPRLQARAERFDGGGVMLRTPTPLEDVEALAAWSRERRIALTDLDVRRPQLEDVYLHLIQPKKAAPA